MPTRRAKKISTKTFSLEPKFLLSSILGNVNDDDDDDNNVIYSDQVTRQASNMKRDLTRLKRVRRPQ